MDRIGAVGKALSGPSLLLALEAGANVVGTEAKIKVPARTANLRRSIHVEGQTDAGGRVSAQVGTNVSYGPYVEFGTGIFGTGPGASRKPIIIVPKFKRALFWPGAAHPVMRVVIQGMKPRPYLRPAFDEKKDEALNTIADVARRLVVGGVRG